MFKVLPEITGLAIMCSLMWFIDPMLGRFCATICVILVLSALGHDKE